MKKCLLIGGAGFIGTNLSLCLADAGYEVTVCDFVPQETVPAALDGLKYVRMNYFEQDIEDSLLRQQDVVVLLISSVSPNSSMANPEICYGKDVVRLTQLLEQMRRCGVGRLVFVSSGGTVYGNQDALCLREDMATYPINHYGIMKLTQEKILFMYNELYRMDNLVFRLANPYGAGQKKASGVGAVTAFLRSIMDGEKIYLYGQGESVRDYIHVKDAVNMMRLCMEKGKAENTKALYNVGTGQGHSIMEVLKMAEMVTGKTADVVFLEKRQFDVARNVLDITKIRSLIGDYACMDLGAGMKKYYDELEGAV